MDPLNTDGDGLTNEWELRHGVHPEGIPPEDDSDGDGYPAWFEFALDMDPAHKDAEVPFRVYVENDRFFFEFVRSKAAVKLGYIVTARESHSLIFPMTFTEQIASVDRLDGTQLVTYRSLAPVSTRSRNFMRVRVSRPE